MIPRGGAKGGHDPGTISLGVLRELIDRPTADREGQCDYLDDRKDEPGGRRRIVRTEKALKSTFLEGFSDIWRGGLDLNPRPPA